MNVSAAFGGHGERQSPARSKKTHVRTQLLQILEIASASL